MEFESSLNIFNDEDLYFSWNKAVIEQLLNPYGTNVISEHNSFFYKAIIDFDYRSKILGS